MVQLASKHNQNWGCHTVDDGLQGFEACGPNVDVQFTDVLTTCPENSENTIHDNITSYSSDTYCMSTVFHHYFMCLYSYDIQIYHFR